MTELFCKYCHKEYKNALAHRKHEIFCKCVNDARNDNDLCVNNQEVYLCLKTLLNKYISLEEEVKTLRSYVAMKKRSINIEEWLNENVKADIQFSDMISKVILEKEDLVTIFNKDFKIGMVEIISKYFDDPKSPIKCFEQKHNQIYIFEKNVWKVFDDKDLNKLINEVHKKILILFVEWQKENQGKINNEKFQKLYTEYTCKVMGSNFIEETIHHKIKFELYKKIKINVKQMETFEIVF